MELIIVLLIVSLLTFLVTPRLTRTFEQLELRSAVQRISAILRYCRSDAVNKNKVYLVSLDRRSNLVRVLSAAEGDEKLTPERSYPLPRDLRFERAEVGKTLFEVDSPSFEFYPQGGSNGGTATIGGAGEREYTIDVDFITGTVKVGNGKEK